jgi:hypothetical protein
MSKKHFKELADMMWRNRHNMKPETFRHICDELASFCAKHNPNFDRTKFLEACGV